MAVSDGVVEGYRELLADFGPVEVRRMFGGAGLYRDGMMFALVAGDDLFLKTDAETRGEFDAAGSEPFAFGTRTGRGSVMSYWRLPASAADDAAEALRWARLAFEAALRAKKPKGSRASATDLGPGPWDE